MIYSQVSQLSKFNPHLKRRILGFAVFFCLLTQVVFALPQTAEQSAQQIYTSLIKYQNPSLDQAKNAVVTLKASFDFQIFFSRCARDIEASLTPTEKNSIQSAFEDLFFTNFEKKIKNIAARRINKPSYQSEEKNNQIFKVSFKGQRPDGQQSTFAVFLHQENNAWRLVDLEFDGALLSRQYQGSFNKIFREKGAIGLLQSIKNKATNL